MFEIEKVRDAVHAYETKEKDMFNMEELRDVLDNKIHDYIVTYDDFVKEFVESMSIQSGIKLPNMKLEKPWVFNQILYLVDRKNLSEEQYGNDDILLGRPGRGTFRLANPTAGLVAAIQTEAPDPPEGPFDEEEEDDGPEEQQDNIPVRGGEPDAEMPPTAQGWSATVQQMAEEQARVQRTREVLERHRQLAVERARTRPIPPPPRTMEGGQNTFTWVGRPDITLDAGAVNTDTAPVVTTANTTVISEAEAMTLMR